MRLSEIHELTMVRLRLFLREPEAVFWSILFPVILSVVLGFAFSRQEIEPSRILVLDGPGAAEFADRLAEADNFNVQRLDDEDEARLRLRRAAVDVVVRVDEPLDLRLDPQRPEGELARHRLLSFLAPEGDDRISTKEESETGFRYIDFLFPGLIGMNLMGTGIWAIGFAVVDMRRKKLLKRMLVTPMSRGSFLFSFMSSRLLFLGIELAVLLPFGLYVLGVPFSGSALAFGVMVLAGMFAFAAIGLLTGSRPRTIEGASGIMNFVMMPMWLGSGVFFSYERFPEFLQPVLAALPLSAVNDGLRAVMLDGAGLGAVLDELAILVAWTLLSFVLALKFFRWQ